MEGLWGQERVPLPGTHPSFLVPIRSHPPPPLGEPGPPQGECNAGLVVNWPKLGYLLTFIQTENPIGWEGPWQKTGQKPGPGVGDEGRRCSIWGQPLTFRRCWVELSLCTDERDQV